MRNTRHRTIITTAAALVALTSFTGCGTASDDLAASALEALRSQGTWTADATWSFASVGEPVVMTGVGTWTDEGEHISWTERWGTATVTVRTVDDHVIIDDGIPIPRASRTAQERIRADLFHQLDPLRILNESDIELTTSDPSRTRWTGEGTCLGDRCKLDVTLSRHPDGRPARLQLRIEQPDTWIRIDFRYRS